MLILPFIFESYRTISLGMLHLKHFMTSRKTLSIRVAEDLSNMYLRFHHVFIFVDRVWTCGYEFDSAGIGNRQSVDEEPIVNTDTQQEVVTPVKPDDISLPIYKTSGRVSKHSQFYYDFHIEEDKISDSTLNELD
ncbi:hypothetical protein Tco_0706532 [Tanacetum coccineum]|uniref:Uncharacterized protein n=1 Tax=Tanacetum coccineum TaxID=301880 RepID=A0ABQ4Y7Q6_9ASTR